MNRTPLEIAIRAYTQRPNARPVASKLRSNFSLDASPYVLVFDCETTTGPEQRLKFGFYQVRKHLALESAGIFYDPDALTTAELAAVDRFALRKGLTAITVAEFRKNVFLRVGYDLAGMIVGFNLPFDLSRIALDWSPARGTMRGGFSFKLTGDKRDPSVRVKHLSARASLIDFAAPGKQETPRGMRKRGQYVPHHRGYFVDVKTLAAALTSQSFSLQSLATFLKTPSQKLEVDEHGGPVTTRYLAYAQADVQVTWECYLELLRRYAEHGLDRSADRILSEASLGKGYLARLGVRPLLAYQPSIPRSMFGTCMASYFGGRAEVRIRRVVTQVLYCDFKSMYPTVNALMGLWPFVIGSQLTWKETTEQTQAFLNSITLEQLQRPETWKRLHTFVRLSPNDDILPVRAEYDGKINTIGLNYLTSAEPLWYTLADCIASKLLSERTPQILEAITFSPGPPQDTLEPFDLFGREDCCIDPLTDDPFLRLIDLRDEAKAKGDEIEKALKIVANSTVYGIFIEVERDDAPKPEPLEVFGPDGSCQETESTAIEQPGRYFHPLLGTLITGAARLMLATAEALVLRERLGYAFCDTDSIAIARPNKLSQKEFLRRCAKIVEWFVPLNPYRKLGSILKIEDINYASGSKTIRPLWCFAISAKRYALFNLDSKGRPVIGKASAHGLGHLMSPYPDEDASKYIPAPAVALDKIGVRRWQYDLWHQIITAALNGHPNQVRLDYHPALQKPAISRYGATSPRLLDWMKRWNEGKAYAEQVKPFGFMTAAMPRTGPFMTAPWIDEATSLGRGRPKKPRSHKPIAPFTREPDEVARATFDRETGEPVPGAALKTYAEALAQYHLSPEEKFENGDFLNCGKTKRRQVIANGVRLIGKEANRVGVSGDADPVSSPVARFASHR